VKTCLKTILVSALLQIHGNLLQLAQTDSCKNTRTCTSRNKPWRNLSSNMAQRCGIYWFLSGNIDGVMQHLYQIWAHQIEPNKEKVVYGRGSPEMKFSAEVTTKGKEKEFQGALPTTIYQAGFSEVYGREPDIDSTALIVSTTSWILARSLKQHDTSPSSCSETSTVTLIRLCFESAIKSRNNRPTKSG
jgi:hypothetical protein